LGFGRLCGDGKKMAEWDIGGGFLLQGIMDKRLRDM